jgi:hypothetical protein
MVLSPVFQRCLAGRTAPTAGGDETTSIAKAETTAGRIERCSIAFAALTMYCHLDRFGFHRRDVRPKTATP